MTPTPASPGRRHFMRIVAAGAGRLSVIAASSSLLASTSARGMGMFPRDTPDGPGRGKDKGKGKGNAHCFARGTLISTAKGEVPVEELQVGQQVLTTNGPLPIKWVGCQTIRKNGEASWHPSVVPIRVSRFAIDDQTPRRDLYLSPNHCLLIDGFLMPVKHLVNESTIVVDSDAKAVDAIEYFSVELDRHEVVFAEGTAVETFRYAGGQIEWDNLADYQDRYGFEHPLMDAAAPVIRYKGGRAEVAALLRLAASRFVDVRDPIQLAYSKIAARALAA